MVGGEADEYEKFIARSEPADRSQDLAEHDPWLVMSSSGTTGRPKGVMLSHRNMVAHTVNAGTIFPFEDGDRNLVAMPLFHVGGTSYAMFGLYAGVRRHDLEPDPAALFAAFADGVTHAFLVPPVIAGIVGAGERAIAATSGLKYLGYGAAPMPLPLLHKALAAWPKMRFAQVYGQTEV